MEKKKIFSKEQAESSKKMTWKTPCLKTLDVSETYGEPGANQGDAAYPNTANPKLSH